MSDNEKIAEGICISPKRVDHCPKCIDVCEAHSFKRAVKELEDSPKEKEPTLADIKGTFVCHCGAEFDNAQDHADHIGTHAEPHQEAEWTLQYLTGDEMGPTAHFMQTDRHNDFQVEDISEKKANKILSFLLNAPSYVKPVSEEPETEDNQPFGDYINELRLSKDITLREFCRAAEFDPSNWSKVERGIASPPKSKHALDIIAKVLNLSQAEKDKLTRQAAIYSVPADFRHVLFGSGSLKEDVTLTDQDEVTALKEKVKYLEAQIVNYKKRVGG